MRIDGRKKTELFNQLEKLRHCQDKRIVVLVNTIIEKTEVSNKDFQQLIELIEEYMQRSTNILDKHMNIDKTCVHINAQILPLMESIVYRYKIGFYEMNRKRKNYERKNKRNFD